MIPLDTIEELTNKVSRSVERVLNNINDGLIATEPNMTDRLLANIERDFEANGENPQEGRISISVRTLQDRGRNSAEKKYGADLATLLDVDLPDYKITKGFLAQSKWERNPEISVNTTYPGIEQNGYIVSPIPSDSVNLEKKGTITLQMNGAEFQRLLDQCKKMLKITPDSFVFIYSEKDVYVIAANEVVARKVSDRKNYPFKNLKVFMEDYLKCFVGDRKLTGVMDGDFEALSAQYQADNVLFFEISQT